VSMVVDGAQVASVLLGESGVIEAAHENLLCVDMSTIAPGDSKRIAQSLAERGVKMLDAPVTGSSPRAEAGTLTIMAGGEPADFERARPLLESMGKLVVHVGELGQGETLKLINNALGAANAAALAEALLLASATGVDLDAFVAVTSAGSGASAQLELKSGPMRTHDYATLFKTEHMLKDVRLCLEEAQTAGVPFPAAAHARDLLAAAMGRGYGDSDYAAIWDFRWDFVSLSGPVDHRSGRSSGFPPQFIHPLPCFSLCQLLSKNGRSPSAPSPKASSS
jgi:3-hydroxyisobutyrate dehydrogenase-like beta-hydroxyacid dehydrogenase